MILYTLSYFYAKTAATSGIQGGNGVDDAKRAVSSDPQPSPINSSFNDATHRAFVKAQSALLPYALPQLMVRVATKTGRGNKAKKHKIPRFPSPLDFDNKVYNFIQTVDSAVLTSSVTVPTFGAFLFTIGDLPQISSFSSVFDQYRIAMVTLSFKPNSNSNISSIADFGLLHTVVDYDDANVLSSIAAATDYTNVIVTDGYKVQTRTFVPHIAVAAYSGTFTSYQNETAPWIDMASTAVQHYGVKTAWGVTSAVCKYQTVTKYWIQCRSVR